MREAEKRHCKMLIGVGGMVPLVAVLLALVFPEAFPLTALEGWQRGFLAGFIGFSYCFGLMKWVFPNG